MDRLTIEPQTFCSLKEIELKDHEDTKKYIKQLRNQD